jgi:hexosaminidase
MRIFRTFVFISLQFGISVFGQSDQNTPNISIIPKPNILTVKSGNFELSSDAHIIITSGTGLKPAFAEFLKERVKKISGWDLKTDSILCKDSIKCIVFTEAQAISNIGEEGYLLSVTSQSIVIKAKTKPGFFYGLQTLLQLLPTTSDTAVKRIIVPCLEIADYPRFPWRGMLLDVSRHFMPKESVKKYIDLLALHKMNIFHWHLTDDQGWRIEIKKYPKLTEVGAYRLDRGEYPWMLKPSEVEKLPPTDRIYGGFYTQDEIRDIVSYAEERCVTIVPEIEMPAHCMAALAAYPELSCNGGPFTVPGGMNAAKDAFCPGNDRVFEFLENVLTEVIGLFPGKYIHIGGDEVALHGSVWAKCPKCKARMRREKLKNAKELQSYFIKRIEKFLDSKNRKLIGWDEILFGGIAPEATVMSWHGIRGGIAAAKAGHNVIMTPNDFCYFDHPQTNLLKEAVQWGIPLTIEKVYSFDPVPFGLSTDLWKYVLGGQANIWTELIQTPERAEYMMAPRICAMSEVLWTDWNKKNYVNFKERLVKHYPRMDELKINYFIEPPTGIDAINLFTDSALVELQNKVINASIHFTTDSTEPTINSPVYAHPFKITAETLVKAKTFMQGGRSSTSITGAFKKQKDTGTFNPKLAKPGIFFRYYEGNMKVLADWDNLSLKKSGTLKYIKFPPKYRKNHFALDFTGYISIPSDGVYTFYLSSDDGSSLEIAGNTVVWNDGVHGMNELQGKINLKKGYYPILLKYFENSMDQGLKLYFSSKEFQKQEVPENMLFH